MAVVSTHSLTALSNNLNILFIAPIGSYLIDRYGCRMTTIIGAIIAAIGFILSTFSPNIYIVIVTIGIISGNFLL